ncbi:hypothetical protein ACFOY2_15365 [Nonomuraea purpurea]|uniref:WD40 repeat domain-containing protein n=1 Tax=Nonomuraea purpurea TaxID=1849276 RepID=A0ABV8G8U2_9ACTN
MRRLIAAVLAVTTIASCAADKPAAKSTAAPPRDFRVTLLHDEVYHGVALSAGAERAVISSVNLEARPPRGSVAVWDLSDPMSPRSSPLIPDRGGTDVEVALSGDGKHAATFTIRGQLTLWDLTDLAKPSSRTLTDKGLRDFALNHDGRYAMSSGDAGVHFWDLTDPDRPRKRQLLARGTYDDSTYAVALSGDARRALVSPILKYNEGEVTLWNLSDPTHPEAYVLLRNVDYYAANSVALSGDGNHALIGFHRWTTYEDLITYWDLRTWDKSELRPMTGWKIIPEGMESAWHWRVSLDQDGKHALIAKSSYVPGPEGPPYTNKSTVRFWALDSLSSFGRFKLTP